MSYPLFELLALAVGSISIIVAVVATLWSGPVLEEVVAQGLLLIVLVGAVHRGRKGGLATAVLAILTYTCMRVPLIIRHGFSSDVVGLILVRTLTYGVLGIGGGALCGRIRHFMARFESSSTIDGQTQLFNERFISRTLRSMVIQYERFHKPFSVVILSVADLTAADPGPDKRPSLRAVATHLRDHVRLIDDVARLDDGRLLLVLPQTDKSGARVAADRLGDGVRRLLGAMDGSVGVNILGAREDLDAIRELCGAPASAEDAAERFEACA